MPNTPGTSAQKTIDPSIHHENPDRTADPANPISSVTHDPFEGIEAGRTVPAAPPPGTTSGGGGTDTL